MKAGDQTIIDMPWGLTSMSGDFGIEIEIEGNNLPASVTGWVIHEDNSLRNTHGMSGEYVTRLPVPFAGVRTRMHRLEQDLSKEDVLVVLSPRCSTHLHMNMQHQTFKTYFGTLLLYALIEPVLLRHCGPERDGNLFCMPLYATNELAEHIDQVMGLIRDPHDWWPNRGKYSSINTDAIRRFGSLEVRCFPNTYDTNKVVMWSTWMHNIREFAAKTCTTGYDHLMRMANTNRNYLLATVFGKDNLGIPSAEIDKLLSLGLENSYEAYRTARCVFDLGTISARKPRKRSVSIDDVANMMSLSQAAAGMVSPSAFGVQEAQPYSQSETPPAPAPWPAGWTEVGTDDPTVILDDTEDDF